ncbi:MAG TPA: TonB-dependent receptor [Steroidobacter sp.]|uniref:TonB-dependent receptor n=1 Tax=Steroidobacter sp. TaxID=1978227 RepID=UPI002ED9314C
MKRTQRLSTTVLYLALPAVVAAQEAPETAERSLEEIVVTAQRRSESLQSVPVAVTAITSDQLTRQGAVSLQDMTAIAPSFVAVRSAGYGAAPLSIRGVGGANGGGNLFSDEPVAVYVDGAYVARLGLSAGGLTDIESVQVLRGPQGTLYGRNSTAGALLLTTRRPTSELEAYVEGSYNDQEEWRMAGALSGPIAGDVLQARLATSYYDVQGWGTNVVDGSHVNGVEESTVRLSLRFAPTSSFTADLIAERFRSDSQPGLFRVARITGGAADSPWVRRDDFNEAMEDSRYAVDTPNYTGIDSDSATLLAEWDAGPVVFNSLTAYRTFHIDARQDNDGLAPGDTPIVMQGGNQGRIRNEEFTQELRLSSPDGQDLSWVLGAFYISERNRIDPFVIFSTVNFFGLGTDAVFHAKQRQSAHAFFLDASYNLTSDLTARVGVRYSSEEKDFENRQQVITRTGGIVPIGGGMTVPAGFVISAPPLFKDTEEWHDTSFRAVLDYRLTRNVMSYVSYNQGFKSGGFNAFGLSPAFEPETIEAFEVGLKSEWLDSQVRVNLAAFDYSYDNLQVRIGVPTGGVDIRNAAAAEIKGGELETVFLPLDGLKLSFNLSYLDAQFTKGALPAVPADAVFRYGTTLPLASESIVGNRLSRAPEWQGSAALEYEFDVSASLRMALGGHVRFQSTTFFLETSQEQNTYRQGAWEEVGAFMTLSSMDKRWSATLFADNLTDERYLTQVASLAAFPFAALNQPRRVGVRARYSF